MSQDATFEDGAEKPLRLMARDADDLQIIATLTQDAVFPITEIRWQAAQRRFALLVNRFRWEDRDAAAARGRDFERVQALLVFEDVLKVSSTGVDRSDSDMVYSVLDLKWEPAEDGMGRVVINLAGDADIALEVETLEAQLKDVTRPYIAPSKAAPSHPED
ncbi:DUF2948 family protein [Algirhabdus cladophorae]|uniref:DUF2948 family protein n=1 Tax=Algirhabdus cladophorae TaxID=3377108 RepID=UPI003B846D99